MKNQMTNKNELLKTFIIVIAAFILYKAGGSILNLLDLDSIGSMFFKELVFLIIVLIAAFAARKIYALKPGVKYFGTGILVGWWFIFQPLMTLWAKWGTTGLEAVTVSSGKIVMFLAAMLLIGICEELLFRGIMLNGLQDTFGADSPARIRKAVIISGCVFGAFHLFNVFGGASFAGSFSQAIANMGSGALLGAVYIRSRKNLWTCVLLHAWMDALGMIAAGALAGTTIAATISTYSPIVMIPGAIEFCLALFAMRKKKLLPLVEKA